jgi:IDEAL domain.
MVMKQRSSWKKGDWVKGRTVNGELMYGYVVDYDSNEGAVKVAVVACDRESTIGRTIETLNYLIKPFPLQPLNNDQLRSMTDLALITSDREWFMDLSAQLARRKQAAGNRTTKADSWFWSPQR